MSDELLPYYNRELAFFRSMGAEFARSHPRIAARLSLGSDASQDPHVERMVEAFAYLNARIRHKLDDDFPEITDALLGVLYPHYQNPIPSMAVVQMSLDRNQALSAGHRVERGTWIEAEEMHVGKTQESVKCRFHTCYPLTLWPVEVDLASLSGRPFAAPMTPKSSQATAVLKIGLSITAPALTLAQLQMDSLRFFLHAAPSQNVHELYELIFNHTLQIALASGPGDTRPVVLPPSALRAVGFERDEALFPTTARSFPGYRLLSEYFSFPEKFLFFDLAGLDPSRLAHAGNKLEIYLYLSRTSSAQELSVSRDTLRLGCTPAVNLFPQRADPFQLTQTATEYRVAPDAYHPQAMEIYTIDRVMATSPSNEQVEYVPFYSFKHAVQRDAQQTFWSAMRRPAGSPDEESDYDAGTDVYLSFVDLGFSPFAPADWTISAQTTCFNRDLPRLLPFGGGRPSLELPEGRGPVASIVCLTAPTPTRRPALKHGALWRLVSHLTLNHLSLIESGEGAEALREILMLYDVSDSSATRDMIKGVMGVASRRIVGRAGGTAGGFCRGLEIQLNLDEDKFIGSGAYLFASVIDRFLGLYCSINSFTRLVATSKQRAGQGDPWKWPQRAGEKALV